jgi:hypothetical protein
MGTLESAVCQAWDDDREGVVNRFLNRSEAKESTILSLIPMGNEDDEVNNCVQRVRVQADDNRFDLPDVPAGLFVRFCWLGNAEPVTDTVVEVAPCCLLLMIGRDGV